MVKTFRNIYNLLFIISCIIVIIFYYQKCQEKNIIEKMSNTNDRRCNKLPSDNKSAVLQVYKQGECEQGNCSEQLEINNFEYNKSKCMFDDVKKCQDKDDGYYHAECSGGDMILDMMCNSDRSVCGYTTTISKDSILNKKCSTFTNNNDSTQNIDVTFKTNNKNLCFSNKTTIDDVCQARKDDEVDGYGYGDNDDNETDGEYVPRNNKENKDIWKWWMMNNLATNEEIERAKTKPPSHYKQKFEELDQRYKAALEKRKQAEIDKEMNPGNEKVQQEYDNINQEIDAINGEFQISALEFASDVDNVKNDISKHSDNVEELMEQKKQLDGISSSLNGSEFTAKRMYKDYVLNYQNSYKNILLTIISIGLFYFVVYKEMKFNPNILMAAKQSGAANINKLVITKLAIASTFALFFIVVYNIVVFFIDKYIENKTEQGEEPELFEIPLYALDIKFTERGVTEKGEGEEEGEEENQV